MLVIRDSGPVPGSLVAFDTLLEVLLRRGLIATRVPWVVGNGAYGHGEWICSLEDSLEGVDSVEVDPEVLLSALADGGYFDDVEIVFPGAKAQKAGDSDRTFLFVVAPEDVLRSIATEFKQVDYDDEDTWTAKG